MSEIKRDKVRSTDPNLDPITGEPGAHPVGTGIGAAAAGAAVGAAAGAVAGPVGTVLGAAAGAVAGGLAGKEIAEHFDPTAEDAYWRERYSSTPYYDPAFTYEDYQPAYRHGWESRQRYPDASFDVAESLLQRDWESASESDRLDWERARHASRDAWVHADQSACSREPAGKA